MSSLGWDLIQCDWPLFQKTIFYHRHSQEGRPSEVTGESRQQAEERSPRRNQPCKHSDLSLLNAKINLLVNHSICAWLHSPTNKYNHWSEKRCIAGNLLNLLFKIDLPLSFSPSNPSHIPQLPLKFFLFILHMYENKHITTTCLVHLVLLLGLPFGTG